MKPAPFRYHRAESLEEAAAFLDEHGDDAKIIAGGQSLAAMLNMRLVRSSILIDINRIRGHAYIFEGHEGLRIGALARHRQLEWYGGALNGLSVMHRAARLVGHYPVRARGTFGGSIAHADPAAEWCILAVLFDAEIRLMSVRGRRSVRAENFFRGFFTTAAEPDEIVSEVVISQGRHHAALLEFARRHGDFAIVAVAVAFDVKDGACQRVRTAIGGVESVPFRSRAAEAALEGQPPTSAVFSAAAELAAGEIQPSSDVHGTAQYRRHLTRGLFERACAVALAEETGSIVES